MKTFVRRILTITPVAVLATWVLPLAAHAGFQDNHNETLVRRR
jgi:hypothetical protein